jgi:uncharacterized protein (DUF58 family)
MKQMLSYPGLYIEVWVPTEHNDNETYAALRKLQREVRALAKTIMPKGVRVTVVEMD